MKVTIISNQAIDETGRAYEIKNVVGFDDDGGEHVYSEFNYPDGHEARAQINSDGTVTIL